jgi:hypothetical protein
MDPSVHTKSALASTTETAKDMQKLLLGSEVVDFEYPPVGDSYQG